MTRYGGFKEAIEKSIDILKVYGTEVDTGHWQGIPTGGKPDLVTREWLNLTIETPMPETAEKLAEDIKPNMPWAEAHFQERVSRVPSNPGVEYENWPWWQGQYEVTAAVTPERPTNFEVKLSNVNEFKFDHTYQERFWPSVYKADEGTQSYRMGIRYRYGDLDDVVNLLWRQPYTRQATFPIFFPEDTGAVHGGRIPCTLHYHFLRRGDRLHLWYPIRSCDAVRHFRDDLYMACRLAQWVIAELVDRELRSSDSQHWVDVSPGMLYFTAYSFHVHMGDYHLL